ncbi:MAG: hypothetical protein JXB32_24680 [Deltaproteobacteria bacterium]|nr:hypothetical protein [Deltaproteobacteria bacterium]
MVAFACLVLVGCSGAAAPASQDVGDGLHDARVPPDAVTGEVHDGLLEARDAEAPPVAPAHCGDGVLDPDEECDDGNRLNGDDCDWLCRRGPGEPVDHTPDPGVGDLERDVSWTPVPVDGRLYGVHSVLLWTGSAYATAWVVHAESGPSWGTAQFRLFDRLGRAVVPDWTYEYPDRSFSNIDLAWSGRVFALVWSTPADGGVPGVYGLILDAVGKPLIGPFTLLEDPGGCIASVTWDGEAFAAVWFSDHGEGIGLTRFDELGSVVAVVPGLCDPGPAAVQPRSASSPSATVIAFVFSPPGALDSRRLRWLATADGRLLRPPAELGPLTYMDPVAIAWGESRFGIVFDAASDSTPGLHLALLDQDGLLVGPPRRIVDGVRSPIEFCASAWGAGGWLIAYVDRVDDVRLLRTDAVGAAIRDLATADESTTVGGELAMAFDGEGFGILSHAHVDPRALLFTRYVVVP